MSCFIPPSDLRLATSAFPVRPEDIPGPHIQSVIYKMLDVALKTRVYPEIKAGLCGLAAPQLGILSRIILVGTEVNLELDTVGKLEVFINPEIIDRSSEIEIGREGCCSVDSRISGIVSRALHITMRAFDGTGLFVERRLSGIAARIFQHELDHLDGIRFPDRVGRFGVLHLVGPQEHELYREEWQTWSKLYSWDSWLMLKQGRA